VSRRILAVAVTIAVCVSTLAFAVPVAAQQDATMTISVVDQQGNPISGATVTASWDGGENSGDTAGNGKVFLDVPSGSQVQLSIDHPGYVRNQPRVIGNAQEGDYTVEVHRRGRLTATLRDSTGPVQDARMRIRKVESDFLVADTTTNGQGVVDTGPIEYGTYSVFIQKPGYPTTTRTIEVNGTMQPTFQVNTASTTITFNVVDDHFEEPRGVDSAQVTISGIRGYQSTSTTLDNGEATASVPVNSRVEYTITKDGYPDQTGAFQVNESERRIRITTQRTPAISLEAANNRVLVGESVTVTVRNQYDEPVAGVGVSTGGQRVAETNDQGIARVPVESTGNLTITAQRGQASGQVTVRGVEAAAEETPTPTPTPADSPTDENPLPVSTPGFTPIAALVALLAVALLARRRN
jgi:PGF-CTERM protein